MQEYLRPSLAKSGDSPAITPPRLAALMAKQVADLLLAPPKKLLLDCRGLPVPHPWGVACFVTQLLQLHQRGAGVWLYNVHPVLSRCLHRLQLGELFHLGGAEAAPATPPYSFPPQQTP